MRRTARALSVAVLASAALGVLAEPGSADSGVPAPVGAGEPAAGAAPADAATVARACAPAHAAAPSTQGDDATTPRTPPAEGFGEDPEAVDPEGAWSPDGTGGTWTPDGTGGDEGVGRTDGTGGTEGVGRTDGTDGTGGDDGAGRTDGTEGTGGDDGVGRTDGTGGTGGTGGAGRTDGTGGTGGTGRAEGAGGTDGTEGPCPSSAAGDGGEAWGATKTVPGEGGDVAAPPCPEPGPRGEACGGNEPECAEPTAQGKSCGGAIAEHGVRAGVGGSFSDSVPALVAGGVLIAGACGAAAHRLRLRLRGEDGEHRPRRRRSAWEPGKRGRSHDRAARWVPGSTAEDGSPRHR
ncbi:hypothetical protein [Streptomyces lancefieldiae]|uniref:Uncharacterized protein n=1 Tax=Streptomyces lancefieldiae TaxID=3075520 RepID=A0ABU3ASH8_9ACTN|nr:hypothetical protein [Streptomyces sp. DSM 40712]MDT0613144.1 hypothetical protein [Streptomyces sp. DSM 40712]